MNSVPVLFEDKEILIVDKAAGIAVQGGAGISHSLDKELPRQLGCAVHLVHRLDRDTAGLMLVAKSSAAAAKWTALIASGQVRKEYRAVCIGRPPLRHGTLRSAVNAHGRVRTALTEYAVERSYSAAIPPELQESAAAHELQLTELRLVLGTGRMHQIRIQTAQAGFPILADDRHGDFRLNKLARRLLGARQLFLLSQRLCVPLGRGARIFEASVPCHFKNLYMRLNNEIKT